ncbi:DUF1758 domain-containing protein [Trichonephila clavipes]|nr:DUF1758 domain-containing protein [Trichonephila clavipes]
MEEAIEQEEERQRRAEKQDKQNKRDTEGPSLSSNTRYRNSKVGVCRESSSRAFAIYCEPLYTPTEIDKEIEAVEHYFDKSAPWQFRAKKQLGKDVLEIKDPFEKKTRIELEEASEDHFAKHVTRDADGRYVVSLPWIPCHSFLSNCRNLAERRLKNCVRSLERSNNLGKYETVFHNLLNKDIIEEVQKDADKKNEHYLSHHPVYKDNSTTKIRPVFDGAAKEKTSSSINECLEKGPNMLELIPTIINKFRLRKFGIIAHIEKAFLQINIEEKDRDHS